MLPPAPAMLGRIRCGYGLALAFLAQVMGAEGDMDSPGLADALRRAAEGDSK